MLHLKGEAFGDRTHRYLRGTAVNQLLAEKHVDWCHHPDDLHAVAGEAACDLPDPRIGDSAIVRWISWILWLWPASQGFTDEPAGTIRPQPVFECQVHLRTDAIHLFYTPRDLCTYRRLLPAEFQLPADPLVHIRVCEYSWMTSTSATWHTAAVALLGRSKGEYVWHGIGLSAPDGEPRGASAGRGCPPRTTEVTFERKAPVYTATVNLDGEPAMVLRLDTRGYVLTDQDVEWSQRVRRFGGGPIGLLDLLKKHDNRTAVKVGTIHLSLTQGASPACHIEPKEIVLAYYYRDKFRILPGAPLFRLIQSEAGDGAADSLTAPSFAAGARLGAKQ
jgi:hypothetical protein